LKRRKKSDGASARGPAAEGAVKRPESAGALKAAQQYFQKLVPPGVSLADQIVQEHRHKLKRDASED
jgi:hypothetical protein